VVCGEWGRQGAWPISSHIIQHHGALSQMQIEAFVGETVANMLPGMFKLVGKCGKVCCGVSVLQESSW